MGMRTLDSVVRACVALGGSEMALTTGEARLVAEAENAPEPSASVLDTLRRRIHAGRDPLGDAFSEIKSSVERRPQGQVFTPRSMVQAMIKWAEANGQPERVVDPGVGSGRFLAAAAIAFPNAALVGADVDPLALLMARANLAVLDATSRASLLLADYRSISIAPIAGSTLYVGNPPYVRHHNISPEWKEWLIATARARGHSASALAGLHAHFYLATAEHAMLGDYGAFVTSSEWLDVNYGSLVRALSLRDLGLTSLHVVEPEAMPFEGTATTAVIATFRVGSAEPRVRLRRVDSTSKLNALRGGSPVTRERMAEASRWSPLTRTAVKLPSDFVELGELCRVHRGTVTGSNSTWIARGLTALPDEYQLPSVTRARELFAAGEAITDPTELSRIIRLPVELDEVDGEHRELVERFLESARENGVDKGYVASRRRAWWSVEVREPAKILATYMARRPPTFVLNEAGAHHINVAHGLYPRENLEPGVLAALARALRDSATLAGGRVYAGGLTKFEPKEMERLPVPSLEALRANA